MSDTTDQKPAVSIAVIDLHLDYLRRDVARLVEAVGQMATKSDIDQLSKRMDQYATRDELRPITDAIERLKTDVQSGSVRSTFDRWASVAQKLAAICAFALAGALAIAHLVDKLK